VSIMFRGYTVLIQRPVEVPNKPHKKKSWMSDNYHKRIQKKWNKRFGSYWTYILEEGQVLMSKIHKTIAIREDDFQKIKHECYEGRDSVYPNSMMPGFQALDQFIPREEFSWKTSMDVTVKRPTLISKTIGP